MSRVSNSPDSVPLVRHDMKFVYIYIQGGAKKGPAYLIANILKTP